MRGASLTLAAALAVALAAAIPAHTPAMAETQGVVAVVNDVPVTERDLTQRIALLTVMDDAPRGMTRKQALQSIIDEEVKIAEATRLRMMPTDAQVNDRIERIAKGMKLAPAGLTAKLKAGGISEKTFRRYMTAMMGFNRIISAKYQAKMEVTGGEVDAKLAEIQGKVGAEIDRIKSDPRMKPVTVYSLMEVTLPVEANDAMLVQARAVEAAQVMKNFRSCGGARKAADGVFNVKIGKKFDADASKLPKPLKSALDKAGEGRAIGPVRDKAGIKLIAFCGSRRIAPKMPDFKMPTRDQVERVLLNDRYAGREEEFLKTIRGKIYVEYRKTSYARQ